jgi:hypothetical protein
LRRLLALNRDEVPTAGHFRLHDPPNAPNCRGIRRRRARHCGKGRQVGPLNTRLRRPCAARSGSNLRSAKKSRPGTRRCAAHRSPRCPWHPGDGQRRRWQQQLSAARSARVLRLCPLRCARLSGVHQRRRCQDGADVSRWRTRSPISGSANPRYPMSRRSRLPSRRSSAHKLGAMDGSGIPYLDHWCELRSPDCTCNRPRSPMAAVPKQVCGPST